MEVQAQKKKKKTRLIRSKISKQVPSFIVLSLPTIVSSCQATERPTRSVVCTEDTARIFQLC